MAKIFNLGYYIKENHIQKAVELLNLQLSQKSPLYNTIDFTIYRNKSDLSVDTRFYYENYVKRDTFYYFQDLFQIINYYGVQRAYKIREFHFISWELMILYYSVGFYIRELLDKYIINFSSVYSKKPINIFYGGNINLNDPKNSHIFYYEDYKKFLHLKENLTKPEEGKIKYAISLDIKSFFYTINHKVLLDIIDRKSYSTTKKGLQFNEYTKEAIEFFLKYLVKDEKGIPVSSQNIISSFLSSVYFSDFDEFIVDNYLRSGKFNYIRYVDDFYLIFYEDSSKTISEIRQEIYNIENDIADFLINNLKLSVSSSKADRFQIYDSDSHLYFLNATGFESPFEQEFDYEDLYSDSILSLQIKDKTAPEIFDECVQILKEVKSQTNSLSQLGIEAKESSFLNNILIHKSCLKYSKSKEAQEKIKESKIFDALENIDFLLLKIKVLLHLFTVKQSSRENLFNFLLSSLEINVSLTQKLTIVDRFMHQMRFLISEAKNSKKIELKKEYENYSQKFSNKIKSILTTGDTSNQYFKLFYKAFNPDFELSSFKKIYEPIFLTQDVCIPLVQQIKQRIVNEKIGFFNVCFNHLLNEFKNIFEKAYFSGQQKTAIDIRDKMAENGFLTSEIKFVTEFFDRRNQNSISHTNEQEIGFWGVGQKEYETYKQKAELLIERIYNEKLK